jgi:hypothetical protein
MVRPVRMLTYVLHGGANRRLSGREARHVDHHSSCPTILRSLRSRKGLGSMPAWQAFCAPDASFSTQGARRSAEPNNVDGVAISRIKLRSWSRSHRNLPARRPMHGTAPSVASRTASVGLHHMVSSTIEMTDPPDGDGPSVGKAGLPLAGGAVAVEDQANRAGAFAGWDRRRIAAAVSL